MDNAERSLSVWVREDWAGAGWRRADVDALIDHPALPAVAAWLDEHDALTLADLMACAVWVLEDGGIKYDDPADQAQMIAAGKALVAALGGEDGQ